MKCMDALTILAVFADDLYVVCGRLQVIELPPCRRDCV